MKISIILNHLRNQHYINLTCPLKGTHQLMYNTDQGKFKIELRDMNWFPYDNLWHTVSNYKQEVIQNVSFKQK